MFNWSEVAGNTCCLLFFPCPAVTGSWGRGSCVRPPTTPLAQPRTPGPLSSGAPLRAACQLQPTPGGCRHSQQTEQATGQNDLQERWEERGEEKTLHPVIIHCPSTICHLHLSQTLCLSPSLFLLPAPCSLHPYLLTFCPFPLYLIFTDLTDSPSLTLSLSSRLPWSDQIHPHQQSQWFRPSPQDKGQRLPGLDGLWKTQCWGIWILITTPTPPI